MISAIVSAETAGMFQGKVVGVHMVMFQELNDGTWATPVEMVELIPEAFPEYTTREVSESEIKVIMKTRQQKADDLTAYMAAQLTDLQFKTFLADARNHLIDYTFGSESLLFWVATTNGGSWGNYTTTGFGTKSYSTAELKAGALATLE